MITPSVSAGMVLCDKDVIDEMREAFESLKKDNATMEKAFEKDPEISAKIKEIRRLNALSTVLEERNRGIMTERNEAIREVKSWKKRYDRLLKAKGGAE